MEIAELLSNRYPSTGSLIDDVTVGKRYGVTFSDPIGIRHAEFRDDVGSERRINASIFSNAELVVQNPDEDVPVVPVPDPAINHPSHYNQGGIECIDAIRSSMSLEAFRGFLKGNQLKYLWRYESKGKAAEDIGKSNWYGAELEKSLKGEPTQ